MLNIPYILLIAFNSSIAKCLAFFSNKVSFLGGTSGTEPACQCRRPKRHRSNHWVRKVPWRRWHGNPFSVLAWRIPSTGVWQATVHRVAKSQTGLNQLSSNNNKAFCKWWYFLCIFLSYTDRLWYSVKIPLYAQRNEKNCHLLYHDTGFIGVIWNQTLNSSEVCLYFTVAISNISLFLCLNNIYICIYICTHIYVYVCIYLYIYTYMHTYENSLIPSSIARHLVDTLVMSVFGLLWIMLWLTWGCKYLFELVFLFSLNRYPGIEFLDHAVVLCLIFWGKPLLFSIVAIPIYISNQQCTTVLFFSVS